MRLETGHLITAAIEDSDSKDILKIYNSNLEFLQKHMDKDEITIEWLEEELQEMKKIDFYTYKIIEKCSGKAVGFFDIKVAEESYLSLLMIHNDYQSKGYGKEIYLKLDAYLRSVGCKILRIDVVTNYDKKVESFWERNGFNKIENVELNWADKQLSAVTMKKYF